MSLLLGILLFSWFVSSILFLPFIKILYQLRFMRMKQHTKDMFAKRTPIFDRFHQHKAGTPVGGGILIIALTSIFLPIVLLILKYFWVPVTAIYPIASEIKILLFTFLAYAVLGIIDDAKKTFIFKNDFFGLRLRHKLIFEIIIAFIISFWLFTELKISIFYIPVLGVFHIGWWYVPLSAFIILAFANAFNITDGLDGLSSGVLLIALAAFWIISASILDTVLSVFLALWIGSILAFLYFNIYPARIFLGDVGSLSFGATLAVVSLILGKAPVLLVIGGIYVVEVTTSLVQLVSKKYLGRRVFKAAPLHLMLQYYGWSEPKIVMRFWILSMVLALFGLWLAFLSIPIPM